MREITTWSPQKPFSKSATRRHLTSCYLLFAIRHAVEDVSSTPLRGKKSSHSHRTPASANTPSTLHKTFKKSKPSVTPATAVPTAMEHSAQKDRKNHYENELLLHNDALHTPVRQKVRCCVSPYLHLLSIAIVSVSKGSKIRIYSSSSSSHASPRTSFSSKWSEGFFS